MQTRRSRYSRGEPGVRLTRAKRRSSPDLPSAKVVVGNNRIPEIKYNQIANPGPQIPVIPVKQPQSSTWGLSEFLSCLSCLSEHFSFSCSMLGAEWGAQTVMGYLRLPALAGLLLVAVWFLLRQALTRWGRQRG